MKKKTFKAILIPLVALLVVIAIFYGCKKCEDCNCEDNAPATVSVSNIKLNLQSLALTVGETATLEAEVSPENATDKSIKWKSDDESVATVSEGKVTAMKEGSATITAMAGGKTADCRVTVKAEQFRSDYNMGYLKGEDVSRVPRDINTELFGDAKDKIPDYVDLTRFLPTIGNQGQYGTCVAWATGYYYRSYLRAKALNLSKNELSDPHNQFSPKDLFWAIPNEEKPDGCNGTYFQSAFNVLQNRGVATMATVPYENLGDCYSSPEASWTKEAANYKITRWRQIGQNECNALGFKSYLSKGIPIAFGAQVGWDFTYWKGGVLKSESSFRGYHAMVICGYDDNKHAFKVVNSWGDDWCEDGFIWIDEDFMFDDFIMGKEYSFVAYSDDKNFEPDNNDNVDDDDKITGYDLVPLNIEFYDYDVAGDPDSDDPTWRTIKFNVYNAGTQTVPSSKNWSIALMYYNAYDATEYGFFFIDYYTDKFGSKGEYCANWTDETEWGDPLNYIPVRAEGYSWNNVDIASGQSVAESVFNMKTRFNWPVKMPSTLNGDYYLALSVDAFNDVKESDETNNMLFVSNDNDEPIHFVNGVPTNTSKKAGLGKSFKLVNSANPNAYTPAEISAFINAKKKDGSLEREAKEWLSSGKTKVSVKDKIHE